MKRECKKYNTTELAISTQLNTDEQNANSLLTGKAGIRLLRINFVRMQHIVLFSISLFIATLAVGQKPDKIMSNNVFKGMDSRSQQDIDDNFNKAKEGFLKVISKEPENAMALLGLSIVYGFDSYTNKDYFEAWKYFQLAEKQSSAFGEDDKVLLNEYFFKQDKKRRNRPLNKNLEWERSLVEEKLIKFVREENNLEFANKFLKEFPDSKYNENVIHIRNYIEFRRAEDAGSVEALNEFIKKYPNAAQVETATELCNALAYKQALVKNSLSALKAFVAEYPKSFQAEDAKKRMGLIAYDEALKTRTLIAIERFMEEYPNSTKMPDAKILKRQLLFEWAKSVNSIDAYNQFVALYPEGEMYIDIFNLKATAMGQKLLMDFPMENYKFIKGFDNMNMTDYGGDIALRPNGEILLAANSRKAEGEMFDIWLLGLDDEGKMKWNKILGNEYDDQVNKVKISNSNEIYGAGITNAIKDSVKGKGWIFKLDATGKNVYNRKLESSEVTDFSIYSDGKVLIGGYSYHPEDSTITPSLTKLNESGKKLWDRTYTQGGIIHAIALHPDNTAFIAGKNWIFAIDENGYLLWDKLFDDGKKTTAVSIDATGKLIFAASDSTSNYAMAFDVQGNKVWETAFSMENPTQISHITPLADLSIICSATAANNTILMTKIEQTGKVINTKTFHLPNGIHLNGIIESGGNFVLVSASRKGMLEDIIVFKLSL